MQIGECLGVGEHFRLGQARCQHLKRALGFGLKPREMGEGIGLDRLALGALVEKPLGLAVTVGRR